MKESERRRTDGAERRRSGMARSALREVDDMKYRFFSIPALMPEDMQDEMNRFCAAHRVINIEKQFVQDGERSYWALCVCYVEKQAGPLSPRKGNVDYREVLGAADFALFAKLRDLRKKLAEQEGVPAYALFTNEQLAQMVQQRVTTKAELAALDGVRPARIEKYGEVFLNLLLSIDISASGTSRNGINEASMS
jgi:superfamily II DNA helicase RecQ